jgi:prefoldin subunit 5
MEKRLAELREQLEVGQQQLAMLDHQRSELRDTLLRIGGAVQVLEELLGGSEHRATAAPRGGVTRDAELARVS